MRLTVKDVEAYCQAGYSLDEMAEMFDTSVLFLKIFIRQNGIEVETVAIKMARLYQSGATINAIADEFGTGGYTVKSALRKHNIPLRPTGRKPIVTPEMVQAMAEEYFKGATLEAIGEEFGLNWTTVQRHFKQNNIPMRPRGGNTKIKQEKTA